MHTVIVFLCLGVLFCSSCTTYEQLYAEYDKQDREKQNPENATNISIDIHNEFNTTINIMIPE